MDPPALLLELLDSAIALQGGDFGLIQLLDPHPGEVAMAAQRGFEPRLVDRLRDLNLLGAGFAGWPLSVEDVRADPRLAQYQDVALRGGFRGMHCTALMNGSRDVLGVICLYFRAPHRASERDLRWMDLHARQAANIVERRRAEEALRRSEENLAAGQKLSHTGSWAWNAPSGAIFWSEEHLRIWGLDPLLGTPTAAYAISMIHPEDRPLAQQRFDRAVREKSDFDCEFRLVRPDGTIRHIHSLGKPVADASGALVEYMGAVVDLTERKNAEEALRTAREELARSNRAMTVGELTASIAHELNQPLAAVVTNAHACLRWLAAEPPNQREAHAALHRIVRDANRASEVIARIRGLMSGRVFQRSELAMAEVIDEVASLVEGEARAKGVALSIAAEGDLPIVKADRVQIQQVLLNFLVNAIDAAACVGGARTVEVLASRDPAGVLVSVRDSGPGVAGKNIDKVFEPFFSTKREGMGMGLAICRSIVQEHGGRVQAMNNDGPGATFRFSLPASARSDIAPPIPKCS